MPSSLLALALSALGAGSSKRTRQPLGAHQEGILIIMKENTAVLIVQTKLFIAFPALENSTS